MIIPQHVIDDIKTQYDNLMENYVDRPTKFDGNFYVTRLDDFDTSKITYFPLGVYYIKKCVWINDRGIPQNISLKFSYNKDGKLVTIFSA